MKTEDKKDPQSVSMDIFQKFVLPSLQKEHGDDMIAIQKAARCWKVTDADGNPCDVELVPQKEVDLEAPAEEEKIAKSVKMALSSSVDRTKAHQVTLDSEMPKHIKSGKSRVFESTETAYRLGRSVAASILGHVDSQKWCNRNGAGMHRWGEDLESKTTGQQEGVNYDGGYVVEPEFNREVFKLILAFGSFAQYAEQVNMRSDVKYNPRRIGIPTIYCVQENGTATESKIKWDQYLLTAKTWIGICRSSNELDEDAFINLGDEVATEFATGTSFAQDIAGWLGSGGATTTVGSQSVQTGGIKGVVTRLLETWTTASTYATLKTPHEGLHGAAQTGTWAGATTSGFTIGDFTTTIGLVPNYAVLAGDLAWYCSKAFHGSCISKVQANAGGNTMITISDGVPQLYHLGYPVRFVNALPTSWAVNQIPCVFGSLKLAAAVGMRKSLVIDSSNVASNVFLANQKLWRAVSRWDIAVHDVGTPNATLPMSAAGPIVGMITQAS